MAYAGKNGYDEDTDILFPIATNIIGWRICRAGR